MSEGNGFTNGVMVGETVVLNTPDNQVLHGVQAKVIAVAEWGAHVATGVGSGHFRAAWAEMVRPPERDGAVAASWDSDVFADEAKKSAARRQCPKDQGYTGDMCEACGSMRMRRNGTCLLCEECGSTSGCS